MSEVVWTIVTTKLWHTVQYQRVWQLSSGSRSRTWGFSFGGNYHVRPSMLVVPISAA